MERRGFNQFHLHCWRPLPNHLVRDILLPGQFQDMILFQQISPLLLSHLQFQLSTLPHLRMWIDNSIVRTLLLRSSLSGRAQKRLSSWMRPEFRVWDQACDDCSVGAEGRASAAMRGVDIPVGAAAVADLDAVAVPDAASEPVAFGPLTPLFSAMISTRAYKLLLEFLPFLLCFTFAPAHTASQGE